MLEVAAARDIVLNHAHRLKTEITALTTGALGQVLAEDIRSDIDSPPFTKSMMDGFAVRSADCTSTPTELRLVGEVAAGSMPAVPLGSGETIAVFTGAPLPDGADAVVMKEQTETLPDGRVRIHDNAVSPGRFVLERGREMAAGEVVLPAGTVITPAAFGLFAAVGKTAVPTYSPARVAVIATGNELVEANMVPKAGQIRNSNGPMLVAQAVRAGALPRYLGIARDDPAVLASLIREGMTTSTVLVLAGGVSVGKHDHVPAVLRELGVEVHFHSLRMKPGKPLLFGTKGETLVFGLPGNPVSSFVGFELFVRPAIRKLGGHAEPGPVIRSLPLAEAFTASNNRPTYHPAALTPDGQVRPLPWFGSPDLRGLLAADALAVLPAGDHEFAAGQLIEVVLL